ncbi:MULTISPECIES: hypothetical protein [Photorhabdus]|uniref:Uncharacterized protein n=1 Tax=Photorhabdus kayaii TaxID=230088 RepID=A0ABX0AY14_9GAMM|nr:MULTISPECIES: hypothetical protein [Photorhabdus]MCC8375920.1 hypothetical protein [Photorhabdus bodei]MDB6366505.1 hypothetical protein [Photorhabdus bodei]NDK93786.1 hypothetical protein [Photorhabdus laumondii subsp. laumondii]NDL12221.1 hypothetical protein [Photorhabdus kayaii]NDL25747.1 hypothetical protein [Photorhabdus kayaii]
MSPDSRFSYDWFLPFYLPEKRGGSRAYTQWISSCIAAARERIPGSIANYVTGGRECSQQRGSLKDDGYIIFPVIDE